MEKSACNNDLASKKIDIKALIRNNLMQYTMGIALLMIWVLLTILTNGTFISVRNLSNLFLQTATTAIIAFGMVLVIVSGNIDLSVGSIAGFCGGMASILMVKHNIQTFPTILITLTIGLVIGCWQGFWIAIRKVPAIIVTLSSMLIFRGALIGITGGTTIGPTNPTFKFIGQGFLPEIIGFVLAIVVLFAIIGMQISQRRSRVKFGLPNSSIALFFVKVLLLCIGVGAFFTVMLVYRGIPIAVLLVLMMAVLFNYIAQDTRYGRHIYAIGGNKEAAKFSGINIRKSIFGLFAIMGALSALAGVVFTARLNSGSPAAGTNFEMDAIAAAIIGGTSTVGGEGSIFGALIGALVMASIDNGMSLLNLNVIFQYAIKGLVLLLAVAIDVANRPNDD